jgi:stress response protein YsnF
VEHEEVRVEREPITEANREAAMAGPNITESEHEVTPHEERPVVGPVVGKETEPKERVRLGKETATEEETVGGEVRKERIDEEMPEESRTRRR